MTLMPERSILLRAAMANPDDDAPWAALTDWLIEHDEMHTVALLPMMRRRYRQGDFVPMFDAEQ